jgi:hypothetical protein
MSMPSKRSYNISSSLHLPRHSWSIECRACMHHLAVGQFWEECRRWRHSQCSRRSKNCIWCTCHLWIPFQRSYNISSFRRSYRHSWSIECRACMHHLAVGQFGGQQRNHFHTHYPSRQSNLGSILGNQGACSRLFSLRICPPHSSTLSFCCIERLQYRD